MRLRSGRGPLHLLEADVRPGPIDHHGGIRLRRQPQRGEPRDFGIVVRPDRDSPSSAAAQNRASRDGRSASMTISLSLPMARPPRKAAENPLASSAVTSPWSI